MPALAAGVLALAVRIPEPRPATAAGLDLPGAALLAAALMCLVHTLVTLPQPGRPAATAAGFAATAVAAAAFVHRQRRTTSPLIPPSVLRTPAVTHGLGVLLCASAALFGALFLATYLLQDVLALDPLTTGLWMLPLAVTMVLAAPASAALARRQGPRRTTAAGMTLLALGALAMSRLDQGSGAWATGVCCALLGAGFGTVMVTATTVVVQRAPRDAAGVTGGLQQTAMNTGPALGVATATMLTGLTAPGPTLAALAGIALLGAFLATRLPDGERRARTRP
ncbi:hypothetical protein GCM10014713_23840 [Streptomyces purpureus]|uniref:Major facilitator superfamily (MFS) profile domain-containing protein n=1 Tax=Streptomyces purpureus TaxID=1951 RepID=A0A918H0M0_9ACTN|nr:hypothetical protein GCM10014713_23840 [Streptomyces purpureus]